jgi:hypothetical protein
MYHSHPQKSEKLVRPRRHHARYDIQCRAKIRIGTRQYAGYIHNISRGGAKLRTVSPIRRLGNVVLTLPGLEPLRCQLRWTDSYNAGVSFGLTLSHAAFSRWVQTRLAVRQMSGGLEPEIAELAEFVGEEISAVGSTGRVFTLLGAS